MTSELIIYLLDVKTCCPSPPPSAKMGKVQAGKQKRGSGRNEFCPPVTVAFGAVRVGATPPTLAWGEVRKNFYLN